MSAPAGDDRVVVDFLLRYLEDRAAGTVRPLAGYLAEFPGREEQIAAKFLELERAGARGEAPPAPEEPPAGVLGPYALVSEIGRGGQGAVWLAEDTRLRRRVALKVLHRGLAASDDLLLRFRREAEITARLDHPGICVIHEIGRDGGTAWMAMRLVEGTTLAAHFAGAGVPRDRAAVAARLALLEKAARAADAAHGAGVVHRDLKPTNIMVTPAGEPVILDFGLARDDTAEAALTRPGSVFGTPAYMPPEQLDGGAGPADRRADVYALGVILYLALTGRLPYDAPTFSGIRRLVLAGPPPDPRKLNPAVGRDLAVVIATATDPDPGRRYRTAGAFAEDLRRVREGRPILARPAGAVERLRRFAARNPGIAALAAALFLALGGGLVTVMVLLAAKTGQERATRARERELRQVSDQLRLDRLLAEERDLWPAGPALVDRCRRWLDGARAQLDRRGLHEEALRALRARGGAAADSGSPPAYADDADAWFDGVLSALLAAHDRLRDRLPLVEDRLARSLTLEARTVLEPAAAWETCRAAVRSSPRYGGLELRPQVGLVPLGASPHSELWEFWHAESGARPEWDTDREAFAPRAGGGLILVLVPAGRFTMGDDASLGPFVEPAETPPHEVALDAFFLAKYELTQDQWQRGDEGRNPALYQPGTKAGKDTAPGEEPTLLHPVERVTWTEARAFARRLDLVLPTEAQWERAARAGTSSMWSCGDDPAAVAAHANTAGAESPPRRWEGNRPSPADRHRIHAPAGSYRPNPFGLHDMHGNVWEWCRDALVRSYAEVPPAPGDGLRDAAGAEPLRVLRGGSFWHHALYSRNGRRNWAAPDSSALDLGLRPARAVR